MPHGPRALPARAARRFATLAAGRGLRVYSSELYTVALPERHTFPMHRYAAIAQAVQRSAAAGSLFGGLADAPLVDMSHVRAVHDAEYVEQFVAGRLSTAAVRKIGFPWSEAFVKRTQAITGGSTAALRDAMHTGVGANAAGGTHHAFRAHGEGYCIWNDIVVVAHVAKAEYGLSRIAVIDLDVHQVRPAAAWPAHIRSAPQPRPRRATAQPPCAAATPSSSRSRCTVCTRGSAVSNARDVVCPVADALRAAQRTATIRGAPGRRRTSTTRCPTT